MPSSRLLRMSSTVACTETIAGPAGRAGPLRLWVGLDARAQWWRSAYVDLPMKLRPSPLYLIFLDLTDQGRTIEPARVRWRALDFDTF